MSNENSPQNYFRNISNKISPETKQEVITIQQEELKNQVNVRLTWKHVNFYIPKEDEPEGFIKRRVENS